MEERMNELELEFDLFKANVRLFRENFKRGDYRLIDVAIELLEIYSEALKKVYNNSEEEKRLDEVIVQTVEESLNLLDTIEDQKRDVDFQYERFRKYVEN